MTQVVSTGDDSHNCRGLEVETSELLSAYMHSYIHRSIGSYITSILREKYQQNMFK